MTVWVTVCVDVRSALTAKDQMTGSAHQMSFGSRQGHVYRLVIYNKISCKENADMNTSVYCIKKKSVI